MSIALSEFWNRLIRAGVTDSEGCKRFAAAFRRAHRGTLPSEPTALATFLVKTGQLTKYQARALLDESQRQIRFGNFLVRGTQTPGPFSQWLEANQIGFDEAGVLYRAHRDQVDPQCESSLAKHAELAANGLQRFHVESDDGEIRVFCQLPPGRCLGDLLTEKPRVSPRLACRIGIAAANALESLHRRSVVHGAVRPERIWMTEGQNTILLRDPSRAPGRPMQMASDGWLDDLEELGEFAAPEFANVLQTADTATDIYSLGCLLFRLATGRSSVNATNWEQAVAEHANSSPPELVEAIERGATGDPLLRAIAHAMARNRQARFSTAGQLAKALEASLRSLKGISDSSPTETIERAPELDNAATKKPESKPTQSVRPQPVVVTRASTVEAAIEGDEPKHADADAPSKINLLVQAVDSQSEGQRRTRPPTGSGTNSVVSPRVKRRRRNRKAPLVLAGLAVIVLLLGVVTAFRDPSEPVVASREIRQIPDQLPSVTGRSPATVRSSDKVEGTESPAQATSSSVVAGYKLIDEQRFLYVPSYPANTQAAPLELLPPGAAVVLSCRIESILDSSKSGTLYDDLSGELAGLRKSLEARSGFGLDEMSRFSVALHPGGGGQPEYSLAVWLKQPQARSELVQRLDVSELRTREGVKIFGTHDGQGDTYYFADSESEPGVVSRFAIGSVARMTEVAEQAGGAIALPRALQTLWNFASEDADLVALVTPNFLFADGRSMLLASAPELVRPLRDLLIPDITGVLFVADEIDDQLYIESRFAPSGGITEVELTRTLSDTVGSWPKWADTFVVQSNLDPAWRLLATRLPLMMRFASDHFRVAASRGLVVANGYLPQQAATQITIATLLAANTPAHEPSTSVNDSPVSLTIEQILDRKMSVSFDQESLEFAIETIVVEYERNLPSSATMPPVRIVGSDLQKMGITQNQQVRDFNQVDQPLRRVLTDLVVQANPDKSATGPDDPKQSLIWVIAKGQNDDTEILITTRQAAQDNYALPAEFEAP